MEEQNIPIDIHTNKLLDWLISRRHVKKEWLKSIPEIRDKINISLQDMPVHDGILKLLSGQYILYFHCLKIVDFLKETEADTKNVFGRYGSQRMKDWQDIISNYQKDNVYLAEASQILIRNVKYEIPNLKKQITKLQQTQVDCEDNIKSLLKAEASYLKEYQLQCDHLGISGKDIENELMKLVEDLPKIHEKSVVKLKEIKPAVELYEAFSEYFLGNSCDTFKLIRCLIDDDKEKAYDYLQSYKVHTTRKISSETNESNNEIDFGDDIDFEATNTIDFEATNTIDFEATNTIDWNIKTDEEFEIIDHSDISSKSDSLDVATKNLDEINTNMILDCPSTRIEILNNLLELETFLKLRMLEMVNESDMLSMSQLQNAPSLIQLQTVESITKLMDAVSNALSDLTDKRTQHLYNLKHSANYGDILTSNLNQKLMQAERTKTNKEVLKNKIIEIQKEIVDLNKVLNLLISNTKELQKKIQNDISNKYKGRLVNIIGGINVI